ncbi:MAG TPA: HDOD domain-containing protein [Melioribacteraceae bacterium]|nr:HDOD domain-containing protein [Melioribacteraceae bacterium]
MYNNSTIGIADKIKRVEALLSSVNNLPSIPLIINEVNRVIEDPGASAAKLAKIINKDQAMVTKILSLANSPLYGIPRRVSTIDFAIIILGFNHIKNIIIALSMIDAFKSVKGERFDQQKYWVHSLMVATLSKKIADDLGHRTGGEVFTAGLLHDLGIPIIFKYFNNDYIEITKIAEESGTSIFENESNILGLTHAQVGRFLIDKWNLPVGLANSVQFHHQPGKCPTDVVVPAIIHLADIITQRFEKGDFFWDKNLPIDKSIIDILKLGNEEYLEQFILSYQELVNSQVESLNI